MPTEQPTTQTAYAFDRYGIYTGVIEVQRSPLEPGQFLLPRNATYTAPPTPADGELAVHIAGAWVLLPDLRGLWYGADGSAVTVLDPQHDTSPLTRTAPPGQGYSYTADQWQRNPIEQEKIRANLIAQIDGQVAAIYAKHGRFSLEYTEREAQAKAYKEAGYTGTVPPQVQAFAGPAGKTPQEATDIILTQSAQLRGALSALGILRMRKYEVMAAAHADMQATAAPILAAISAIAAQL